MDMEYAFLPQETIDDQLNNTLWVTPAGRAWTQASIDAARWEKQSREALTAALNRLAAALEGPQPFRLRFDV